MTCEVFDYQAANLVGAALLASTAARSGIRAILIKGFSLEFHGLRAHRTSADVDLLVEPGRATDLVATLKAGGWVERPSVSWASGTPIHSVTLIRAGWPNDFDIHHEFPGLLVGPASAFEVLWRNRQAVRTAGVAAWVPDRSSSIVLWALHSLRGLGVDDRCGLELDELVSDVLPLLDWSERVELGQRISELGASGPLLAVEAFSPFLGAAVQAPDSDAAMTWGRRVARVHPVAPWLRMLGEARPVDRPALAWLAVWPTAPDLRLLDGHLVDTPVGRVQARFRRIRRLVTAILQHTTAA